MRGDGGHTRRMDGTRGGRCRSFAHAPPPKQVRPDHTHTRNRGSEGGGRRTTTGPGVGSLVVGLEVGDELLRVLEVVTPISETLRSDRDILMMMKKRKVMKMR